MKNTSCQGRTVPTSGSVVSVAVVTLPMTAPPMISAKPMPAMAPSVYTLSARPSFSGGKLSAIIE